MGEKMSKRALMLVLLLCNWPGWLAAQTFYVATNGIDRFVGNLGVIAEAKPDVLDKFDADRWADAYADMLGIDLVLPQDPHDHQRPEDRLGNEAVGLGQADDPVDQDATALPAERQHRNRQWPLLAHVTFHARASAH